jgi:TatA/E family protein of Tat protein translocase
MPGFGHWWLILIILAIALIVFGPARLPELGAGLGRAIREFRKGASEMTENLKDEVTKPDQATGTTHPPADPAVTPPPPPADPGPAKS